MPNPDFNCVMHLGSVGIGVTDLARAIDFYTGTWGLELVSRTDDLALLRGGSCQHHVLALHRSATPAFVDMTLDVDNEAALRALVEPVTAAGGVITEPIGSVPSLSGGMQFSFRDPEGRLVHVQTGGERHASTRDLRDRPVKVSHVVLNSTDPEAAARFFMEATGFRLSDTTAVMRFIRCNTDHHSIAFARGAQPSLNHIAFEMPDWNGMMHGLGRLKEAGFKVGWGLGRHGPGDNVFAYFVDPDGLAIEYTAEVQQVDEATHVAKSAEEWNRSPSRMDQWGYADLPADWMKTAMEGRVQWAR